MVDLRTAVAADLAFRILRGLLAFQRMTVPGSVIDLDARLNIEDEDIEA